MANIIGWATRVRARSFVRSVEVNVSARDHPASGAKWESISAKAARKRELAAVGGAPHARPLRAIARKNEDDRSVALDRAGAPRPVAGMSGSREARESVGKVAGSARGRRETLAHALTPVIGRRDDARGFARPGVRQTPRILVGERS